MKNDFINLKALAHNILTARNKLGLNQREFANVMDVTQASIATYEKGHRAPSLDFMTRLSDLTKISIDELIDGTYDCDDIAEAATEQITERIREQIYELYKSLGGNNR